jgi:signal transduction histidine kinase
MFAIGQILSNALKYTPKRGEIHIYDGEENLTIADNGIGIRAEDLPRVFERGFTGYNGRKKQKATGIGLYLCRSVLMKLGHEITITSTPGEGTCVALSLTSVPQVLE